MTPAEVETALRDLAIMVRALRNHTGRADYTSSHSSAQVNDAERAVIALSNRASAAPRPRMSSPVWDETAGLTKYEINDRYGAGR